MSISVVFALLAMTFFGAELNVAFHVKHNFVCLNSGEKIIANLSDLEEGESFRFFSHQEQFFNMNYSSNYECNYEFLLGDRCEEMHLFCPQMDLAGDFSRNCINEDNLHFMDNFNTFQESYCGTVKPNYTTTGQAIFLSFRANEDSKSGKGFQCEITCLAYEASIPEEIQKPDATLKPEESVCRCGRINRRKRIIGGTETRVNEYPWQVALVKPNKSQPFCGGALVDDEWVMTAAHCTQGFQAGKLQVVLGDHDHTLVNETNHVVMDILEIRDHPRYNGFQVDNDFSLLRLAYPLVFGPNNKHIRPVCLPELPEVQSGSQVVATGWGATQEGGKVANALNHVRLELFSLSTCRSKLGSNDVTDNMICAGHLEGGRDSCQGDSGGPLVHLQNYFNYHLIGVTSWGFGCGRPGLPGVYANLLKSSDWWKPLIGDVACPVSLNYK